MINDECGGIVFVSIFVGAYSFCFPSFLLFNISREQLQKPDHTFQ